MGRLIDADKLLENQYRIDDSATLSTRDVVNVEDIEDAIDTVEAIPKDQYEARLKADMVAMLKDIKKEFDVLPINPYTSDKYECKVIIQQKINALRGDKSLW